MAKKVENELILGNGDAMPSFMSQDIVEEYGNAGTSQDSADNLIPFLYVIQKGSPIADPDDEAYDENVKVGQIMNTASGELYDSLVVQPCHFAKMDVEWKLRENGGGIIDQHEFGSFPDDDLSVDDKGRRIMPNGNQLVETKYHTLICRPEGAEPFAAVLPLSSTGLRVSRGWMNLMNSFKTTTAKGRVTIPSFSRLYQLATEVKSNAKGSWRQIKVEDQGFVTTEQMLIDGRELFENMRDGTMQADTSTAAADVDADDKAASVI